MTLLVTSLTCACGTTPEGAGSTGDAGLLQVRKQVRSVPHGEAVLADVDEAVQGARDAPGSHTRLRLLFVPPDAANRPFAGTGGARNVAFLAASSARLGHDVASFSPPGDNFAFLTAAGVSMYRPHLRTYVRREQTEELDAQVRRFATGWARWRSSPSDDDARAETLAAYAAAAKLLVTAPENSVEAGAYVARAFSALPTSAFDMVAYAHQLAAALAAHQARTCIVDLEGHAFAAILATDQTETKVVWYVQNVGPNQDVGLLAQCAHVIGCSETAVAYKFADVTLRHPPHVAANGVAIGRFGHDPSVDFNVRKQLDIPEDAFVIGQVSAFNSAKGQTTVAQAFALLLRDVPNAYLVFVGPGDTWGEGARVRSLLHEQGADAHTRYLGARDDVATLLPAFDVFVSGSHQESYSLAVAEAMAASRPLVLTSIPALEALAGDSALYFAPGDAEQARRGLWALRDPQLRQAMGQSARQRLSQQNGDNGTMLRAFLQALEAIAQER